MVRCAHVEAWRHGYIHQQEHVLLTDARLGMCVTHGLVSLRVTRR